MALQLDWTAPDGANYPECYVKIIVLTATPNDATLATNWYADRSAWEAGAVPLLQNGYVAPVSAFDDGPIFAAGDLFLLTLPDFAGATIVPDAV